MATDGHGWSGLVCVACAQDDLLLGLGDFIVFSVFAGHAAPDDL